ncbi:MAG: M20/M25/M40 family metallo-hydrolase [Coriobacteriia bacterium]|nr:M20/M25/M40 family metallo-hydrolase [Coriobacteriia bacterium]
MSVQPTDRLLETFFEAVRIDSPSGQEAAFGAWCAGRLEALGCSVRFDGSAEVTDSDCGNLIAELPGTAEGRTIVLCAHLDTVEPGRGIVPVMDGGVIRSAGQTILGADDKSGIAAILEALARVRESGRPHARVRVLFTTGEELGLQGAKALDPADCCGDLCLVLDADGSAGGIVTAAPTHYTFKATFQGRAAHAGVEPEKGVSAIAMAAEAIAAMPLGRLDPQTTANVGSIRGGRATNVVTAECVITGECRSIDAARAEEVRAGMDSAMREAASACGGSVNVRWTKEYDGFRFDEADPALRLVESAFEDVGIATRHFPTGGGSDGNVLTAKGLTTLVLSCGMTHVHGVDERIAVEDLEAIAAVIVAVLDRAVA